MRFERVHCRENVGPRALGVPCLDGGFFGRVGEVGFEAWMLLVEQVVEDPSVRDVNVLGSLPGL